MQIICPVVGAGFRPVEAKNELRAADIGTIVQLEPDTDNEYDPRAVAVMLNGHHVGFVPRDNNGPIHAALLEGDEVFAEIISFATPLKPIIEITL